MASATWRLFDTWEAVLPLSPARRALGLIAVSAADIPPSSVGSMAVGERDRALLDLRAAVFGPTVTATSHCPACEERVELNFDVDDVRTTRDQADDDCRSGLAVEHDGWSVTGRLPSGDDIVRVEQAPSEERARDELWRCCALEVRFEGRATSADDAPEPVRARLAALLEAADPQADVQLRLCCPVCDTGWEQAFDIASFLWAEVDTWARRLLGEVHVLARAYGWSEDQVLALSPLRRRAYLEMVAA